MNLLGATVDFLELYSDILRFSYNGRHLEILLFDGCSLRGAALKFFIELGESLLCPSDDLLLQLGPHI